MCGIAGFISNKEGDYPQILQSMMKEIAHRGPDDEGVYSDSKTYLGFRRLSIIDLKRGRQPLFNEDNSVVVLCNGEIYNHDNLRTDLKSKGHIFKSESDAEVITHLYEEKGLNFPAFLDGMFAVVLWDKNKKRLILLRDRVGVKPLYYYSKNNEFVFASEIKSILKHPKVSKEIDQNSLGAYFSLNYVPYPATIFKNIYKVPPAHMLIWENGNIDVDSYWFLLDKLPSTRNMAEEKWISLLRNSFIESVEKRLMSDVPLGVLLSGGLDSSSIVAALAMIGRSDIPTFSVSFKGMDGYDENRYSRIVSRHFKTNHTVLDVKENCIDLLEKVVYQMDEPIADKALIPSYLIFQQAAQNVKVILSGEGADELFGGYDKYQKLRMIPSMGLFFLNAFKGALKNNRRMKKLIDLLAMPNSIEKAVLWDKVFMEEEKKLFFDDYQKLLFQLPDDLNKFKTSLLQKSMLWDLFYYLPENLLMKVDKLSMVHGLEARVPFLDSNFVQLAMRLPMKLKIKNKESKYVMRKMFTGVLPSSITNRPKHGFTLPIKQWLKNDQTVSKFLHGDFTDKTPFLKSDKVKEILHLHQSGKGDYTRQIWNLLTWSIWAKQNNV